jgi:hypothetical protein
MKEYFTTWIITLFIIWCILKSLNSDIARYINMYYLSIILLYGYIIFIFVDMNIKNKKYDKTIFNLNAVIHALPLGYLCYSSKSIKLEYAFETTFILSIIYIVYLTYRKTDIVSVYTDDRVRIRNKDDIKEFLNSN